MTETRVLVVGAGLAGLHAACVLAEAGEYVLVVERAPTIGGAVLRQPMPGREPALGHAHDRLWSAVMRRFGKLGDRIEIRCRTSFAGIDRTGVALVTSGTGQGELFRPRALVVATGATELVRPRPGWTLDGVSTVGAIQVGLKATGTTPEGRVILAGSGPLLFAAGAQLAQAGNSPMAILEEGRPFTRPWRALGLPAPYLREAAGYMTRLFRAGVPILTAATVRDIRRVNGQLGVTYLRNGRPAELMADRIALHDGLTRNDPGLGIPDDLPWRLAGDCNTGLGARAAALDGDHAGREIAALLARTPPPAPPAGLDRERRAQASLARLFAPVAPPDLDALPDETVLCRCEGKTVGDLRKILGTEADTAKGTVRTIRLTGRFGMGRCQGRYCLHWTSALIGGNPGPAQLRGKRWPVQPVGIGALLDADDRTHPQSDIGTRNIQR